MTGGALPRRGRAVRTETGHTNRSPGPTMEKKILIIDDDAKLNRLLTDYFARFNFEVRAVTGGDDAFIVLERWLPDIIILDVMLPGMDGFEVCRRLRAKFEIPVIMLTARGEVTDRVVGLELGADDYLPKPFDPRELTARIQSVLRRGARFSAAVPARFGDLEIDYSAHAAKVAGMAVDLTTMEFELLALFARNPGVVLDRDTIFERIKGLDSDTFDRSIDVLVSRLRQKLGDDPRSPRYIRTLRGAGYKFIAKVS